VRAPLALALTLAAAVAGGCRLAGTGAPGADARAVDGGGDGGASSDGPIGDAADVTACAVFGAPGDCIDTGACAGLGDHTAYPGYCPGAASIQCCIVTPNVANNPPIPDGYRLMQQAEVTAEMTTWAVEILNDPVTYPMFSTTTRTFGAQLVLARVEWHPPDFQNGAIHRGVTLYVPLT
jgi:hypothetical protein